MAVAKFHNVCFILIANIPIEPDGKQNERRQKPTKRHTDAVEDTKQIKSSNLFGHL